MPTSWMKRERRPAQSQLSTIAHNLVAPRADVGKSHGFFRYQIAKSMIFMSRCWVSGGTMTKVDEKTLHAVSAALEPDWRAIVATSLGN